MSKPEQRLPESPVAMGEVVAGRYRLEGVIGAGGMGVVVAARHLELDERVAVKFLLREVLSDSKAVARFVREAKATVKIKSEHVARVLDAGQLEDRTPFMVMEYLEGRDLSRVIKSGPFPFPFREAAEYVIQASHAMAEAHAQGIIHRDLKPANLFLCERAHDTRIIKVLDFGISKLTAPSFSPGMTTTTSVMGSPFYMSPEQLQSSRSVDVRSDIWSLGAVLFELLGRRLAFPGPTLPEVWVQIMTGATPKLRAFRPDVPAELEAVVSRCLEKSPERRFQDMGELAKALAPFAPSWARHTAARAAAISGSPMATPESSSARGAVPRRQPERLFLWGLAFFFLCGVVVLLGFVLLKK